MRKRFRFSFLISVSILCCALLSAQAQNWTGTKLNSSAVTNASGAMIVLGTTNVWSAGTEKEVAFDGNASTFFDPVPPTNAWAGFQLQSPKVVTRIRYVGRSGQAARMNGVLFQGATTSNFTDAVTLHTHTPPANWDGTTWIDVTLSTTNTIRPFTFLRFISPAANSYGGNMAECEFYGAEAQTNAPPVPALSFADSANWYGHLRWTVVSNALAYEVQRLRADESDYTTVLVDYFRAAGSSTWRDATPLCNATTYRIRARNSFGDSDWFTFSAAARNAATGTWIGTAGTYGGNMTGDKAFDANIDTFFDGPSSSGGNGLWTGLDLGAPRAVTGFRFTPRPIWASRMNGGKFEAADNTNFTGAVLLHTISTAPQYTNMTEVVLGSPVTCRYVRYLSPNGGWGNVAEVEFDLAPVAPRAPAILSVVSSDLTNDFPVLSWAYGSPNVVSSSLVYRATSPGGPYAAVTPAGVFGRSWTDTNLTAGVLYYYKVSTLCNSDGGSLESPLSAYAAYRRCMRLERTWDNPTSLAAGVTAFRTGAPYNNDPNVDVDKLFDGSLGTFADIVPSACSVGVDFGKPCCIGKMRFSPRSTFVARVNGALLRGSNSLAQAATLATFANGAAGVYTLSPTTNSDAYRYVFATRLDGQEFYGNLAELELYGWDPSTLTNLLLAPVSVSFTIQPSALRLDWTAGANATSYRVERMPADGSGPWATVGTTSGLTLSDASPVSGVKYLYRVISLRTTESGEEAAYSESFVAIHYVPGSGTGLKGHYSARFTKAYDPAETQALVRVDATVNFSWNGATPMVPGIAESITNVGVVWYGKLIVPHSGTYLFYATTDDGAALRIDNQFVCNDWYNRAATSTGSVALTAGEHLIRLDYYQSSGSSSATLEWAGAVMREVIPASQLIPLDLPYDDIGGWHGRTFNSPKLGYQAYSAASNSITLYSDGLDLSGASEGHHFLWQQIGGSFLLEAKVTQNVDPLATSAKALLMVRNQIQSGSPFLAPARMATGQFGYKARLSGGGTITDLLAWQGAPSNPCWMRIKRVGKTFTTSVKSAGGDWTVLQTFVDTNSLFNATVYAGFAVTSPTSTATTPLQNATFSEIRIARLYGSVLLLR